MSNAVCNSRLANLKLLIAKIKEKNCHFDICHILDHFWLTFWNCFRGQKIREKQSEEYISETLIMQHSKQVQYSKKSARENLCRFFNMFSVKVCKIRHYIHKEKWKLYTAFISNEGQRRPLFRILVTLFTKLLLVLGKWVLWLPVVSIPILVPTWSPKLHF